jgi:hypothetical protein
MRVVGLSVVSEPISIAAAGIQDLPLEASRSVDALEAATERLVRLAVEAKDMDALAAALPVRREQLKRARLELDLAAAANAAEAARLEQREAACASEREALQMRSMLLERREALLDEGRRDLADREQALVARAARFHWRWLFRAWSWGARLSRNARTCDVLFVPGADGYKLLEQTGLALAPNAQLSGLLDEHRKYVVSKIAQLPFDGRWCAYLQLDELPSEEEA